VYEQRCNQDGSQSFGKLVGVLESKISEMQKARDLYNMQTSENSKISDETVAAL
jgi:hypothetical protein